MLPTNGRSMISDIRQAASKLQAAIQSFPSRPEPSRTVQTSSEPVKTVQSLPDPLQSCFQDPVQCRPKPCQGPPRAPPELPRHAQNRPDPTLQLPKAFQNKPEPPRDLRSPPRTFHNLPKQIEIVYVEQPSRAGQSHPDSSSARGPQNNPEPSSNVIAMGPSLYV